MILIVGTGRSGTPCIARLLHERIGVDFGGRGKVDQFTPKGGYAREGWMKPSEAFGEGRLDPGEYLDMLDPRPEDLSEPWGFKHPFLCERMHATLEMFQPDLVIWAWRDKEQTIGSMMGHYNMPRARATAWVERRTEQIEKHLSPEQYIMVNMTGYRPESRLSWVLYEQLGRMDYPYFLELNEPPYNVKSTR